MELIGRFEWIFHIILIILAIMLILCLIRAVIGPRIADRLVSVNMMATMIMCIIVILGVIMDEGYLADIALIYAMISFLAVVVLTKIYTGVYKEQKAARQVKEAQIESEEQSTSAIKSAPKGQSTSVTKSALQSQKKEDL